MGLSVQSLRACMGLGLFSLSGAVWVLSVQSHCQLWVLSVQSLRGCMCLGPVQSLRHVSCLPSLSCTGLVLFSLSGDATNSLRSLLRYQRTG
ncbi:hypothetical protein AVEN_238831-1 [Araneus ventricosus]|uniref:Uncharacterized protein n=1 Tax=Araneus ventricosus TaxID=182803 RepID=A0A4Y2TW93_ARAVE|nr:hypothetical protein AVEN_238831-1 [Araneus ventricosus]